MSWQVPPGGSEGSSSPKGGSKEAKEVEDEGQLKGKPKDQDGQDPGTSNEQAQAAEENGKGDKRAVWGRKWLDRMLTDLPHVYNKQEVRPKEEESSGDSDSESETEPEEEEQGKGNPKAQDGQDPGMSKEPKDVEEEGNGNPKAPDGQDPGRSKEANKEVEAREDACSTSSSTSSSSSSSSSSSKPRPGGSKGYPGGSNLSDESLRKEAVAKADKAQWDAWDHGAGLQCFRENYIEKACPEMTASEALTGITLEPFDEPEKSPKAKRAKDKAKAKATAKRRARAEAKKKAKAEAKTDIQEEPTAKTAPNRRLRARSGWETLPTSVQFRLVC